MANKDSFCPSLQKLTKEVPHLETLELLLSRISSTNISKPIPTKEELEIIVKAAMRAPDWHHLRPYHFSYFSVDTDEEIYKEVVIGATKEAFGVDEELCYHRYVELKERAPALLVISSRYKDHPEVTKRDQFACCFAATYAAQMAAQALGYCSFLFTSGYEKSPTLRKHCGVSGDDEVLAILNIGTDLKMKKKEIKAPTAKYLTIVQSAPESSETAETTATPKAKVAPAKTPAPIENFREKFKAQVLANLAAKKEAEEAADKESAESADTANKVDASNTNQD